MWMDGLSGHNKLWNVLLPLLSEWTINQPSPLRTMRLLVKEMFRENEMSLPTEIKMEEMEHYSRNVEAFK